MIDNPTIGWNAALLAGGALGTVFFAGLWWTARRRLETPARWFIASSIAHAIVLCGFHGRCDAAAASAVPGWVCTGTCAGLAASTPACPDALAPSASSPPRRETTMRLTPTIDFWEYGFTAERHFRHLYSGH
jgi:F1F0 ATPase subunit 2